LSIQLDNRLPSSDGPVKRLVVIGAGTMGALYARAARSRFANGVVELAAIVDADVDRARSLGRELEVPAHQSIEEVNESAIDAAYIALPDHLHTDAFLQAAAAGWAILVEKPLATSVEDARRMIASAEDHHVGGRVNFSNRMNPVFAKAHDRVARGEIGPVSCINARLNNTTFVPCELLSWAASSSPSWFLMSHCLDLAEWFIGQRATEVVAQQGGSRVRSLGVDTTDFVHAMVRYDNGAAAFFESAWSLPSMSPSIVDLKFQIIGELGVIRIDTESQMASQVTVDRGLTYVPTLEWALETLADFVSMLETDPTDRSSLHAGLTNVATVEAIEASARSDRFAPMPVQPGSERS
jgi:predicted dehydrogenase